MIRDLDQTITSMLKTGAAPGSSLATAAISFDLPDATWRGGLAGLTINCYLYDICENLEMRTYEPLVTVAAGGASASRSDPPIRINCSYCITAWSTAVTDAVLDEHDLLSQALVVLLRFQPVPASNLQGALAGQIPPYPLVIASQEGVVKHHPQFWTALDQKLKPSLNYVLTLAWPFQLPQAAQPTAFKTVNITAGQTIPPALPVAPPAGAQPVFTGTET
jgi:Pvc16 N-terminal domain